MKRMKFYKRLILILSCSFLMTLGCSANANGRSAANKRIYLMPVISDLNTTVAFSKNITSGGRDVRVSLAYETSQGKPIYTIYRSHDPEYVQQIFNKTSVLLNSFLKTKGVTRQECRGTSYNLNIIVVSKKVLQDKVRFRGFYQAYFGTANLDGRVLYGYYDSTKEVPNNSTILVTDITPWLNEEVLAHELAHYWWDRLCLVSNFNISSEQFAQEFQSYYTRNR